MCCLFLHPSNVQDHFTGFLYKSLTVGTVCLMSTFVTFASFKLPHIDIIRDAAASGHLGT